MNSSLAEDPVNRLLLSIAEDRLSGFHERPLEALASRCELPTQEVRKRLVSLLRGGIVRAVRQTLPSTSFTRSCLVAWHLPEDALESAFDWLVRHDPFSGHVVLREVRILLPPGPNSGCGPRCVCPRRREIWRSTVASCPVASVRGNSSACP